MRLFVAVDLDGNIREKIWKFSTSFSGIRGMKIVEKENLHITLIFLGEVAESLLPKIEEALSRVKFQKFDILLSGVGFFPSQKFPRVVWVDVKEGSDKLKELADSVSRELKKLSFRRDKEFVAHVTIARIKRKIPEIVNLLAEARTMEFGRMTVKEFKLKQSILRPQGPIYKDLLVIRA